MRYRRNPDPPSSRELHMSIFLDRADAGRKLAEKLQEFSGRRDALILALPRGGVPVAYEVAAALNLALDVFLVRKLRVPDDV
jgi:putative phosphoribosyl transferase